MRLNVDFGEGVAPADSGRASAFISKRVPALAGDRQRFL